MAAIRRLSEAGVDLVVASGRRPGSIRRGLAGNDLVLRSICLDGALGRDLATGETFFRASFEPHLAREVLDGLLSLGLEPVVNVASPDDRDCVIGTTPSTHPTHLISIRTWSRQDDLHRVVAEETILGFGFCGLLADPRPACQNALPANLDLTSGPDTVNGGWGLTVRPPGISKWSAVVAYCARYGVDADRVLAVGDGHNDLELLRHAAVACAVTGGDEELIELADHVIGTPATGGWAGVERMVAG